MIQRKGEDNGTQNYPVDTLFSQGPRDRLGARSYGESNYHYLDTSVDSLCEQARTTLESWFAAFPHDAKDGLRTRFQKDDERQFGGAFFELYCHALLTHQGFEVEVHPDLGNGKTKHPDFKVLLDGRPVFYLESVAARSRDPEREDGIARIRDAINSVSSPQYVLDVTTQGNVLSPSISKRRIHQELRTWLNALDYDAVLAASVLDGRRIGPILRIGDDDWAIECVPIPRQRYPVVEGHTIRISMDIPPSVWIDMQQPMLKRLREKAKKYKDLDLPYIVALNLAAEPLFGMEVAAALFGSPAISVDLITHGVTDTWKSNGLWTSRSGQYLRVSAVLVVSVLGPYSLTNRQPRLWHNPWANMPIDQALWQGHQMLADKESGMMLPKDGKPAHEILGLAA